MRVTNWRTAGSSSTTRTLRSCDREASSSCDAANVPIPRIVVSLVSVTGLCALALDGGCHSGWLSRRNRTVFRLLVEDWLSPATTDGDGTALRPIGILGVNAGDRVDFREEGLGHRRVEMPSAFFAKDGQRLLQRKRRFVGALAGQRVEDVGDRHDPPLDGNLLARESLGITRSVPFLVVRISDRGRHPQNRRIADAGDGFAHVGVRGELRVVAFLVRHRAHLSPQLGVPLHLREFLRHRVCPASAGSRREWPTLPMSCSDAASRIRSAISASKPSRVAMTSA